MNTTGKTGRITSSAGFVLGLSVCLTPVAGPAQDFAKAFDRMIELGLPDTKGAEFGRVELDYSFSDNHTELYMLHQRSELFPGLYEIQLAGNGWKLPGENGKTFTAVLNHTTATTFSSARSTDSEHPVAQWIEADVSVEWNALDRFIDSPDFPNRLSRSPETAGALLLFACHLHRNGLEKEADKLVRKALDYSNDPEAAISHAIGAVADAALQRALESLYAERDWTAFADDCEELTQRFGSAWPAAELARTLAERARNQGNDPAQLPEPEGIRLSPEQQALAAGFESEKSGSLSLDQFGLWIFPPEGEDTTSGQEFAMRIEAMGEAETAVSIVKAGREHLPLLVAMLHDDRLLPFTNPHALGQNQGFTSELDRLANPGNQDGNASAMRPATRADVAAAFLLPLLPGVDPYRARLEDVREVATAWWEETRDLSTLDLARYYVKHATAGDDNVSSLIPYLSAHGEEEDFPFLEELILNRALQSPWTATTEVVPYAQARGDAAKPFLARLEEKFTEIIESTAENPDDFAYSDPESYKQSLTTIQSLLSDETIDDMLARVVSGESDLEEMQQALMQKLQGISPEEAIEGLLRAAGSSDDPKLRVGLIQYLNYFGGEGELSADLQELWDPLLNDMRETGNQATIAQTIAWFVENRYSPETSHQVSVFLRRAGKAGYPLIIERAKALVRKSDPKDIPAIPSASDVSEERRAELESRLLALSDDLPALREALQDLTMAETFWATGEPSPPPVRAGTGAPVETPAEVEPASPLRQAIEKAQFEIAEVAAPEAWKTVESWKGESMTPEKFEEAIAIGMASAKVGDSFTARLKAESAFGPLTFTVESSTPEHLAEAKSPEQYMLAHAFDQLESGTPFVAISFGGNPYSAVILKPLDPDADEEEENEPDSALADRLGRRRQDYWKQMSDTARASFRYLLEAPNAFAHPLDVALLATVATPAEEAEPE